MSYEYRSLKQESVMRLESIGESVTVFENAIDTQKVAHDKYVKKATEGVFPEDLRYHLAHYHEIFESKETDLTTALRYSILVHTYSAFENIVNQLCVVHKEEKNLSLSLSDLRHEGIQRAKVYIKKVSSSNFNEGSEEWNEIVKINKIRNIIAHNDGNLIEGKHPNFGDIAKYISQTDNINLDSESNQIRLQKGYNGHVISIFSKYLTDLFCLQDSEFEN
jgi:hypothetical protein